MRRRLATAVIVAMPVPSVLVLGAYAALWAVAGDRFARYVYELGER